MTKLLLEVKAQNTLIFSPTRKHLTLSSNLHHSPLPPLLLATNNHHHRISPRPQTASTLSNPLQRSPLMPQVKAHNSRRLHTGKVILGIWGLRTHKIWIFKHYIVLRMLIGLYWYILGYTHTIWYYKHYMILHMVVKLHWYILALHLTSLKTENCKLTISDALRL